MIRQQTHFIVNKITERCVRDMLPLLFQMRLREKVTLGRFTISRHTVLIDFAIVCLENADKSLSLIV